MANVRRSRSFPRVSTISGSNINRSTSFLGPSGKFENLNSLHSKLDELLGEYESGNEEIYTSFNNNRANKEIRNLKIHLSHWVDGSRVTHCERCDKSFGFANKKINCRKCGKIFCSTCCQYRRRLSPTGEEDPQGTIQQVCYTCAELSVQSLGAVRRLTTDFEEHRRNKRMILSVEMKRLTDGFEENVDPHSRLRMALNDTLSAMKVPEWQKSSKWLESSEVDWCTKCSAKFNLFTMKHHCRLCGSVFCGACCKSNLLLYFDTHNKAVARLIGVVGCPDKEPPVCIYMSVCQLCQVDLEEYQVQQYHILEEEKTNVKGDLKEVESILNKLRSLEKKLDESLPRFLEVVETYIFENDADDSVSDKSNVEFFAKLQGDLSDLFTEYVIVIQGLKKFEMSSKTELRIMRSIVSVKCRRYNHDMNLFKGLKENLGKSLPAKALQQFQSYANMQAINNTYVMTRQLGFESLNLATKYGFDTLIAKKFSEVDQVCFEELKKFVENTNEDWDEHLDVLNTLLKLQLKQKRFVAPNAALASVDGRKYVRHFLIERSCAILSQVVRALNAKSSDKLFLKSKDALQALLKLVERCNREQGTYKGCC